MRFTQEISVFNPYAINDAVISLGTSIRQTADEIRLEATQVYASKTELTSTFSQTATSFSFTLSQDSDTKASLSMQYTRGDGSVVSLAAQSINFDGFVTFSNLSEVNTKTVINGGNITTGEISLDRINGNSGTLTIQSDRLKINSGTIGIGTADEANRWTIGGVNSSTDKRAWIYSGSKNKFNSRSTAGTYIGTDGISMRGTESGVNNFLELKDGIIKTTCIKIYDNSGNTERNILMDNNSRISIPYGIHVGNGDTRTASEFSFDTYFGGILGIRSSVWLNQNSTTNVMAEDGDSGTGACMRFRSSSNGGLQYVQFDCSVRNQDGSTEFTSDIRRKEEIEYLDKEKVRDFVMKLKPSSFVFKSDSERRLHHGVIAQDIVGVTEERNPYINTYVDDDDGESYYTVAYMEFIADLIATVQLQQQEINELKGVLNG